MENTKQVNTLVLFLSYLRIAVRNLIKYKSMTFIGSFSLVVGMSSFILLMLYFAYRINLSAGLIAFSISIILIVAFLSIAWQTIKAAVTNPAESLRLE